MELTTVDYTFLAIVLVLSAIVLGSYLLHILFVLRRRKEKGLYSIIFSTVVAHFAMWGIAEFYLINGYWYLLGISFVQTIDKVYWILAWFGAVLPIAVGFIGIILYFLAGYEEAKSVLKDYYLNLLGAEKIEKTLDMAKEIVSNLAFTIAGAYQLFDNETKKKIFFKSMLATISGWGIGNIIQDRLCGLLSLMAVKADYLASFSNLYWTLGGDLAAGLTQWILPIVFFAIASLIYIYKG